ncbi:hypothetical protein C8F04DRAFT_1195968 [Mycena alexandri]|uniref:F-box domain-containing protein n=1 Tax=Mycena alexandri TaxID=1745969 RepID=A0AAD6WQ21_9AGAR|nr:hypothetical protein C8F04DRAFT_1195968 [Mycena alexandri]
MPPLPVEHWPFRLHTRIDSDMSLSFSPDEVVAVYISCAGLSLVSLRFEAAENHKDIKTRLFEMADVDPFRAYIDERNSSWTCRPLEDRVTLYFANLNALRAFLEALSHVRVTDRVSHGILHEERHWNPHDVQEFSDLRVRRYLQEPTGRIPIEILSEIFILLPLARNQRDRSSPLLLLRICATWRTVALSTAALWRQPSFIINKFLLSRWSSSEEFCIARFHPPPFAGVHSLKLSTLQSQLVPFLGGARPIFHSLQSLSLELPYFELHQRNSLPSLCCSAPLLQTLIIESSFVVVGRTDAHGFPVVAFNHGTLAHVPAHLCLDACLHTFILRRDHYDYPRTPSPSVRFQPWLFDRSPTLNDSTVMLLHVLGAHTRTERSGRYHLPLTPGPLRLKTTRAAAIMVLKHLFELHRSRQITVNSRRTLPPSTGSFPVAMRMCKSSVQVPCARALLSLRAIGSLGWLMVWRARFGVDAQRACALDGGARRARTEGGEEEESGKS